MGNRLRYTPACGFGLAEPRERKINPYGEHTPYTTFHILTHIILLFSTTYCNLYIICGEYTPLTYMEYAHHMGIPNRHKV